MNIDELIDGLENDQDPSHPVNRELREGMERYENFYFVIENCLDLAKREFEMTGDYLGTFHYHNKEKDEEYYDWLICYGTMQTLIGKLEDALGKGSL